MKKWQHDYVNFTFLAKKKNFLQECKIPFNAERLALAAAVSVSSSLSEKVQRQNRLHVFALGLLHTQTDFYLSVYNNNSGIMTAPIITFDRTIRLDLQSTPLDKCGAAM